VGVQARSVHKRIAVYKQGWALVQIALVLQDEAVTRVERSRLGSDLDGAYVVPWECRV